MEELLRFQIFQIALTVLAIETIVIVGIMILILLIKGYSILKKRYKKDKIDRLTDIIMKSYAAHEFKDHNSEINIPENLRNYSNMIEVVESFDHRFSDEKWDYIKNEIIDKYLLSTAQKYVFSDSWMKRQLAVRCFLLNPSKATNSELESLLNDPIFVIRIFATNCIVQRSDKDLYYQVIKKMSEEPSLSRFSYRDALMEGGTEKNQWIQEILKEDKDPKISAICLDILSTSTSPNMFPLILPFIYGDNKECRILASKTLKNIPSREVDDVLLHCLTDSNWEVRVEALKAISPRMTVKTKSKVQHLLSDESWFVRLQAALALKKSGGEGMHILATQDKELTPHAYEIAQYVLALPD